MADVAGFPAISGRRSGKTNNTRTRAGKWLATGVKAVRGHSLINLAATCTATRALGPGLRAVAWVQGCPFSCTGCIAPDWIPQRAARAVAAADLAAELRADPGVTSLRKAGRDALGAVGGRA